MLPLAKQCAFEEPCVETISGENVLAKPHVVSSSCKIVKTFIFLVLAPTSNNSHSPFCVFTYCALYNIISMKFVLHFCVLIMKLQ